MEGPSPLTLGLKTNSAEARKIIARDRQKAARAKLARSKHSKEVNDAISYRDAVNGAEKAHSLMRQRDLSPTYKKKLKKDRKDDVEKQDEWRRRTSLRNSRNDDNVVNFMKARRPREDAEVAKKTKIIQEKIAVRKKRNEDAVVGSNHPEESLHVAEPLEITSSSLDASLPRKHFRKFPPEKPDSFLQAYHNSRIPDDVRREINSYLKTGQGPMTAIEAIQSHTRGKHLTEKKGIQRDAGDGNFGYGQNAASVSFSFPKVKKYSDRSRLVNDRKVDKDSYQWTTGYPRTTFVQSESAAVTNQPNPLTPWTNYEWV